MGRNESVAGRPYNDHFHFSNLYKTSKNMLDIQNRTHSAFVGICLKRRMSETFMSICYGLLVLSPPPNSYVELYPPQ